MTAREDDIAALRRKAAALRKAVDDDGNTGAGTAVCSADGSTGIEPKGVRIFT